jgi:acetyl-CoA carboxylase carboxyltransferase component
MNRHLAGSIYGMSSIKIANFVSPNQKQELPVVAMFVNGSEQNEQSL